MDDGSSLSARLGAFTAAHPADGLPDKVRHEAKRSILNYFGTALGGRVDPAGEGAIRVLQPLSGPPAATVIGHPMRLDILNAAFLNALNANVLDFDDTHMPTVIHPTAPIAPPLFALAEGRRIPGRDLLHAFALGVEVACRAGNAVSPGHYARGWHITATCGVLGAAAASGKLLGLGAAEISHAIGIAASQAAGLVENLPTGAKNVQMGNAARNGLFAALMAEAGYTAAPQALEGPRGWVKARSDTLDVEALVGGLGASWELMKNAYKAYPCGIVLAPVIDACLDLRRQGLAAEEVAEVTVRGHPLLLARADRPEVPDDRIAKLSIQHSVAIALLRGAAGVREFSEPVVSDAVIAAFRTKVRAEADETIPVEAAIVSARTTGGRVVEAHVRNARGSLETPLTDDELEAKVRDLASMTVPHVDVSKLIAAVWALDASDDAGALMALAVPAPMQGRRAAASDAGQSG